MRLLQVIASLNPQYGGPLEGMRHTTEVHAELGHTTEVLCVDSPDAPWIKSESQWVVHALGPGRFGWGYSSRLVPWLTANASRFDAVVVHGMWQFPAMAAWRVLRRINSHAGAVGMPPYFVMPHGMLDPWFQRFDVRPFKAIRNYLYWWLIENRVVRDATQVFFTCEEERRLARLPFRPYQCNEMVLHYGTAAPPAYDLEIKQAFEDACPSVKHRPYLLFLSRIHRKKGIDLLLKAYLECAKRQEKIPDLVIAGPAEDAAYVSRLHEIVRTSPKRVSEKIHFPGMLTGNAKWGAFYGCEAFVLPSHQENFGIAVVEALACGRPVLISDKVNIWREIHEAKCCIVEEDTLPGAAAMLSRWFALSSAQKGKLQSRAMTCFKEKFHVSVAAIDMVNAIEGSTRSTAVF